MYKEVIWIHKTNNKNYKHDALFKVELSGVVKVLLDKYLLGETSQWEYLKDD